MSSFASKELRARWISFSLIASVAASGALALGGCAAALLGAGAAGGALAYTDRGAKGQVKGDPGQVRDRAQQVFSQMGIQTTGSAAKNSGQEQDLTGTSGDKKVDVSIKSAGSGSSEVEVIAREGTVKWNKDFAKSVLSQIVARG